MLTQDRIHIGVYAICKNESKFVRRWVESMWCNGNGADRAYVLDTGSEDKTIDEFHAAIAELGIPEEWLSLDYMEYESFRFDVARNDNLDMVTEDEDNLQALISVDLDEVLIPEFWDDLREMVAGHPDFRNIYYLYAWNHDDAGKPKRVFWYNKVHPVRGCRWEHAVHEGLVIPDEYQGEYYLRRDRIYLHHWADATKSRSSYLPLLEIRAAEEPDDIYGLYYLMREYTFRDPASLQALAIAQTAYVRLMSGDDALKDEYDCLTFFVLSIADIYSTKGLKDDAEYYYKKAMEIRPRLRQPYISYAAMAAYQGRHELALSLLDKMERMSGEKYPTWYECDYNWTWRPLHISAVAYCWAGQYGLARKMFETAEKAYILTETDRDEAEAVGFYADWQWLRDKEASG